MKLLEGFHSAGLSGPCKQSEEVFTTLLLETAVVLALELSSILNSPHLSMTSMDFP